MTSSARMSPHTSLVALPMGTLAPKGDALRDLIDDAMSTLSLAGALPAFLRMPATLRGSEFRPVAPPKWYTFCDECNAPHLVPSDDHRPAHWTVTGAFAACFPDEALPLAFNPPSGFEDLANAGGDAWQIFILPDGSFVFSPDEVPSSEETGSDAQRVFLVPGSRTALIDIVIATQGYPHMLKDFHGPIGELVKGSSPNGTVDMHVHEEFMSPEAAGADFAPQIEGLVKSALAQLAEDDDAPGQPGGPPIH